MNNATPWWPQLIALLVFVGGAMGLFCYIKKLRRDAMARLAGNVGLHPWPDDSLPRDLSLRGTPFDQWEKSFNAYEGLVHGQQIAVFDVTKGAGRGGWSRTILAVRTPHELMKDWYGLDAQRVGAWVLYYRPVGFFRYTELTPVNEVESRLLALATPQETAQ